MGSNTKAGSAVKIRMESFDDLFGGNATQETGQSRLSMRRWQSFMRSKTTRSG